MEKYLKEIMKIIEGTCGYGIDGKLGESPAGPHLLKLTKAEKAGNPKKYKGKKVGSVQRTKSGKIRMKARACYGTRKKANNAMAAAMMSDIRMKENISQTGVSPSGIPIYQFNYKGDTTKYSGTMAQDLIKLGMNDAVSKMDNGYYGVHYNMIDVDFLPSK